MRTAREEGSCEVWKVCVRVRGTPATCVEGMFVRTKRAQCERLFVWGVSPAQTVSFIKPNHIHHHHHRSDQHIPCPAPSATGPLTGKPHACIHLSGHPSIHPSVHPRVHLFVCFPLCREIQIGERGARRRRRRRRVRVMCVGSTPLQRFGNAESRREKVEKAVGKLSLQVTSWRESLRL